MPVRRSAIALAVVATTLLVLELLERPLISAVQKRLAARSSFRAENASDTDAT